MINEIIKPFFMHIGDQERIALMKSIIQTVNNIDTSILKKHNISRSAYSYSLTNYKYLYQYFLKKAGKSKTEEDTKIWDLFSIEKIPVKLPENLEKTMDFSYYATDGNSLICFWRSEKRSKQTKKTFYTVTRGPINGGIQKVIGKLNLGPIMWRNNSVSIVSLGQNIFIGTSTNDGLIQINSRTGRNKIWEEKDGLPSNNIHSMALYKHYLYMGHKLAFSVLNMKTGKFITLVSARNIKHTNKLNGSGVKYKINAIIPDLKNQCLWLGIYSNNSETHGLWKYEPKKKEFTHCLKYKYGGIRYLQKAGNKMIALYSNDILLIDPTEKNFFLLAGDASGGGPQPIIKQSIHKPDKIFGNYFIGDNKLYDLSNPNKKGQKIPIQERFPYIHIYKNSIYLGTYSGEIYRIKPKKAMKTDYSNFKPIKMDLYE
ncbi:MAG: hypothetical protein U9O87_05730 [Verrucomicrobiota bacterium]|nr:hypothetical protein [Verrucomicrobiota bacterium]